VPHAISKLAPCPSAVRARCAPWPATPRAASRSRGWRHHCLASHARLVKVAQTIGARSALQAGSRLNGRVFKSVVSLSGLQGTTCQNWPNCRFNSDADTSHRSGYALWAPVNLALDSLQKQRMSAGTVSSLGKPPMRYAITCSGHMGRLSASSRRTGLPRGSWFARMIKLASVAARLERPSLKNTNFGGAVNAQEAFIHGVLRACCLTVGIWTPPPTQETDPLPG
jgi:hypothetical protein